MSNPEKRTGTEEYARFTERMVRSYGRKALAGDLDVTALEYLASLEAMVAAQTAETVRGLRATGVSWREVGDALGITRAAAFKRYGHLDPEGARKPGGQPAHRR